MKIFEKYHALGNDYLVLDPRNGVGEPNPDQVRRICDRNRGIGSDGILFGPIFRNGMPCLIIFNPDGSRAEKSGNGLRIFARYLIDSKSVGEPIFTIGSDGGTVLAEALDQRGERIRIDMGRVRFRSELSQLQIGSACFDVCALDIGNPHCVVFPDDIGNWIDSDTVLGQDTYEAFVRHWGPLIEHHPAFVARTNVQFVRIIARDTIDLLIWERGAGWTLASGSSSCAAASAACLRGLVDGQVTVRMPGGSLEIAISGPDNDPFANIRMTGSVDHVASGLLDNSFDTVGNHAQQEAS